MEKNGVLEITNSFPFPDVSPAQADGQNETAANLAAAAPRAKQNIAYSNEMIKFLREVNVDANNVGWYTRTSMGNFVRLETVTVDEDLPADGKGLGSGQRYALKYENGLHCCSYRYRLRSYTCRRALS